MELTSGTFWTRKEINNRLAAYANGHGLEEIQIKVKRKDDAKYAYVYGKNPGGAPRSLDDVEHENLEIHVEIWANQMISHGAKDELQRMILKYIDNCHLDNYLLPQCTEGDTWARCEATVRRFVDENYSVAVFMLDLDHFKQVNDTYDHDTGSRVLFEFSGLIQEICADKAVLIHRSGDEFFIIMPYKHAAEPLSLAYQIRKKTKEHHFANIENIELTAAQGICLITDHNISFQEATKQAEKAYNPNGKNAGKKRDSVRIINNTKPAERGKTNCDLAFCIVKTGCGREDLFQNPYLDFISNAMAKVENLTDVQSELKKMIDWISPGQAAGMLMVNWPVTYSCECVWSTEELAFAAFYGLSRNCYVSRDESLQLSISADGCNFQIRLGKQQLCCWEKEFSEKGGLNYHIKLIADKTALHETKTVVAVVIGYANMPIPETCFYKVIRIDARATRGGSLPDFWEAALSEVIELFYWHPFLSHVIVYGKREYGERFCEILEKCSEWGNSPYSFEFLSKKTRQPIGRIQKCKARIENQYKFCSEGDWSNLVSLLKQFYEEDEWTEHESPENSTYSQRFLERRLSYDKIALGIEDGFKVETMEEAYPTALDIIRTGVPEPPYGRIRDQAGRELKELPNFKVVITKPDSKHVPEYYWEQKEELEQYYQRTFGTTDAFFMKHLQEHSQYESVIAYVASLVTPKGLEYATRRAILVVPHKVEDKNDIAPLGLISVCIAPRRQKDLIVLDFSFTWRTVEAIVGFPYSLYASVKFAESILNEVQDRIVQDCNEQRLKMGSVSYLAHSFHMFLDEESSRIARGVVNDASM